MAIDFGLFLTFSISNKSEQIKSNIIESKIASYSTLILRLTEAVLVKDQKKKLPLYVNQALKFINGLAY